MANIIVSEDQVSESIRAKAKRLYTAKARNSNNTGADGRPLAPFEQLLPADRAGWCASALEADEIRSATIADENVSDLLVEGKSVRETINHYRDRAERAEQAARARGAAIQDANVADDAGVPFTKAAERAGTPPVEKAPETVANVVAEPVTSKPETAGERPLTGVKRSGSDATTKQG